MAVAQRLTLPPWIILLYALVGLGIIGSVEEWAVPYHFFFPFKVAIIPVLLLGIGWQRVKLPWLWLALFFSWIGDIAIHFSFVSGVASFLLAHLAYTYGFYQKRERPVRPRWWAFFALPMYIGVLLGILLPHTDEMTIPVLVYTLVMSAMLIAAMYVKPSRGKWTRIIGAMLFVVSDSVLAINRFAYPFEGAHVLVMTTYMLAQLLMVVGSLDMTKKVGR